MLEINPCLDHYGAFFNVLWRNDHIGVIRNFTKGEFDLHLVFQGEEGTAYEHLEVEGETLSDVRTELYDALYILDKDPSTDE